MAGVGLALLRRLVRLALRWGLVLAALGLSFAAGAIVGATAEEVESQARVKAARADAEEGAAAGSAAAEVRCPNCAR